MKRMIVVLNILFCATIMFANETEEVSNDTYFDLDMVYTMHYAGNPCGVDIEFPLEKQYFEGYKIINDKKYIYRSFEKDARSLWQTHDVFYFRAEGNKVYALKEKNNTEYLLYDFDLQVGDKILTNMLYEEYEAIVTKVDIIKLADGRDARVIEYDNRAKDIEFIGSIWGLLNPLEEWRFVDADLGVGLLCVQKQNSKEDYVIYESALGCDYEPQIDVIEGIDINQNAEIKIYPVPATDIINIEAPNLLRVEIYNELGQKVITTSKNRYDLSIIPNGLYIVKIFTKDGKEYHSKIIKK